MTLCELRDLAAKKLKSYREDCATVARWESETAILGGKSDNMGIRGSATSDPTANVATRMAEPPSYIKDAQMWASVINSAWAELRQEDIDKELGERGKAYVMEMCYGLLAPIRKRNEELLLVECSMSRSTLYNWKNECVNVVAHHASGIV
jgi:hypothetical protein